MKAIEKIPFYGHPNVRATHKTTLAITRDDAIGIKGDCFIGVRSSKASANLSHKLKEVIATPKARITMKIRSEGIEEEVVGYGSPELSFSDDKDLVVRKSDFVCGRTLAIRADKAAADLSRRLVKALQKAGQKATLEIIAES